MKLEEEKLEKDQEVQNHSFKDDARGSMTIFVMMVFTMMIAAAGIAVDIARFEASRTQIQANLDNATLASASLRNDVTVAPSNIVDSYMTVHGLDVTYDVQIIDEIATITYRHIEATASSNVPTWFMKIFGVNQLDLAVASSAEERIPHVEVSLVLDMSGSMEGTKLANLKPAAREFVSLLLASNDESNPNRVSISLVPYATHVNAGKTLFEEIYGTGEHQHAFCAVWESSSSFYDRDLDGADITHEAYFGRYNWADIYQASNGYWYYNNSSYSDEYLDLAYCKAEQHARILPHSKSESELHARINALQAGGNTSIDIAAKWGVGLLDPALRPVVQELATRWETDPATGDFVTDPSTWEPFLDENGDPELDDNGEIIFDQSSGELIATDEQSIDPGFDHRPVDYSDEVTLKAMVLMTDGQNTSEYRIKDNYRSHSNSGVYRRASDGDIRYSNASGYTQLSYYDMWGYVPLRTFGYYKYGTTNVSYWRDWISGSSKNTRLQRICDAAKFKSEIANDTLGDSNPVVIFTIAYDATATGREELKKCATSLSYYHEADTSNISEIFKEIGGVIEKLKLVQ